MSELETMLGEDLREIAGALRPVELRAGDVLCRQGDDADGLYVITAGSFGVYARLPGDRELELATLGAGDMVGELALVDGGTRTATVRALEPAAALLFGRADFAARIARRDAAALAIQRRLTGIVCARLRRRYGALAETLGGDASPAAAPGMLARGRAPDAGYLLRLPFFRTFEPSLLAELLDLCTVVSAPACVVLIAEGAAGEAGYVTLNGAVEETLVRGARRIRVRLAGPGCATGLAALADGGPSPVTAATRERALLLAVPRGLFEGETPLAQAFVDAVQRDLIAALRQAERPQARLAASAGSADGKLVRDGGFGDVEEGAGELEEAVDVGEVRRHA